MSQLIWPRSNTTIAEPLDLDAVDILPAYIRDPLIEYPTLKAALREVIQEKTNNSIQVIRAGLIQIPDPHSGRLHSSEEPVICKVAYGRRYIDQLKKEADIYSDNLLSLQGIVVPLMFGCFAGKTGEGWHVGVLILEDCGVPLYRERLPDYPQLIGNQVVHGLLAIHQAGIEHNDFKERNIVASKRADGGFEIRIIDFERAQKHDCPCTENKFEFYAEPPSLEAFGCKELFFACWQAEIWFSRTIEWNGDKYCADEFLDMEAFIEARANTIPDRPSMEAAVSA